MSSQNFYLIKLLDYYLAYPTILFILCEVSVLLNNYLFQHFQSPLMDLAMLINFKVNMRIYLQYLKYFSLIIEIFIIYRR